MTWPNADPSSTHPYRHYHAAHANHHSHYTGLVEVPELGGVASLSRPHPQNGSGELGREERGAPPPTPGTGTGSATPGGGTRSKRRRLPRCNATPTGYTTIPSTDLNSNGSCGEGGRWEQEGQALDATTTTTSGHTPRGMTAQRACTAGGRTLPASGPLPPVSPTG